MEISPTEGAPVENGLQTQPTETQQVQEPTAEQVNQETSSGANTQGSVSDDTATQQTQTQQTEGGEAKTDDGLAKFAASQGFNFDELTDDTKRALKIAHDNQKAFRERGQSTKLVEATKNLSEGSEARLAALEAKEATNTFFAQPGRDASLEGKMAEILSQKAEQYGKEYASVLSQDLELLYSMAATAQGNQAQTSPVDVEAIRREERESINKHCYPARNAGYECSNSKSYTRVD